MDIILEEAVPFSESLLWKLQDQAYTTYSISAWSEKGVPLYLTSHPLTARAYAQTALAFLSNNTKPVTIIDFGAGTGKFAYLFLKEFLPHTNTPFRYILTDITPHNLDFIRNHPQMKDYTQLEFVTYRHSDSWNPQFPGPVIAITNYFFDTIPQTLYRIQNETLYLGYITLSIPEEHNTQDVRMIPHLKATYTYKPVNNAPDYVQQYASILKNATFLVPSLNTINTLTKTQNPLLWLSADQGVCTLPQALNFQEPKIAKHGTFSVTVSYHFLHWYFQEYLNGNVITTDNPDPTYTVLAATLNQNPSLTAQAFRNTLNNLEPIDYYRISEALPNDPPIDATLALIRAGNWDPINTYFFYESIRKKIPTLDSNTKQRLLYTLNRVVENFYPISPAEKNFYINLATLFYELNDHKMSEFCLHKA